MKTCYSFLILLFFIGALYSQSTEDYFSRPGLKINAYHDACCGTAHPSSFTYTYKTTICGQNVLAFARNDGLSIIYLRIDDKKVYIADKYCNEKLFYDFGLSPGDTLKEGYYKDQNLILVNKHNVSLLNGEQRMKYDLMTGWGTAVSWIEGIGDINSGLLPEYDLEGYDVFVCANDTTGHLWINPDESDICDSLSCAAPRALFSLDRNDFSISFSNQSLFASHYKWNFGNGTVSYDKSPSYDYPEAGCYILSLTAYNECSSSVNENIQVLPLCLSKDWDTLRKIDFLSNFVLKRFSDHLQFIIKGYTLYKSADDGVSWQQLSLPLVPAGITRFITDLDMYDDLRGIAVCGHFGANS
ncbi:MAG: PKD domain-containing protein, partial [Saprospiraceae bacterium]